MSSKWKRPGDALQRMTGAQNKVQSEMNLFSDSYTNSRDLQTRRLRHRFGFDEGRARLLATLCFGERR